MINSPHYTDHLISALRCLNDDQLRKLAHEIMSRLAERMSQNPPEPVIKIASHTLFGMEDEREFKRQFAVQFLASWAAVHYTEYCARGMQETLETPPVEDAEYLAQKAWKQWCAILLPNNPINQLANKNSPNDCRCNSGKSYRQLFDAAGIYCGQVCDDCVDNIIAKYRPEIFNNPAYETNEPKEPDN